MILIDFREGEQREGKSAGQMAISTKRFMEKMGVEAKIQQLNIGDYIIPHGKVGVERKSISDFIASFYGGKGRENIRERFSRMLEVFDFSVFILEGSLEWDGATGTVLRRAGRELFDTRISLEDVHALMVGLQRKGVGVFTTTGIRHTQMFLYHMHEYDKRHHGPLDKPAVGDVESRRYWPLLASPGWDRALSKRAVDEFGCAGSAIMAMRDDAILKVNGVGKRKARDAFNTFWRRKNEDDER